MSEADSAATETILIELLDSATGVPVQHWSFTEQNRILIGRSEESDVVIMNPYVSRSHAYLNRDEEGWSVIAISSQQLIVGGQKQPSVFLRNGQVFRLGSHGSDLKFTEVAVATPAEKFDFAKTMMFDPEQCPYLQLDQDQLQREVEQITHDQYFQNLAQSVTKLRHRRKP